MSCRDYIRLSWARPFDYSGRSRRKEILCFQLFWYAASLALLLMSSLYGGTGNGGAIELLMLLLALAALPPQLALMGRRFHDLGLPAWLAFTVFVPLVGLVTLLITYFVPGVRGSNRYGPDPRATQEPPSQGPTPPPLP